MRNPLIYSAHLAEREGFEPSIRFYGVYSLSRRAPSTYSAISPDKMFMAEEVGFEPTELLHSTVFKTAALSHSATPPQKTGYLYHLGLVWSITF